MFHFKVLLFRHTVFETILSVAKTFVPTGLGKAHDIEFLRTSLYAYLLTFFATPPDRGWQRNEGLLLLHSFLS